MENIEELRNKLLDVSNQIVDSYLNDNNNNSEITSKLNNKIQDLVQQNITLREELKEHTKKNYEYENIINNLNKKMEELSNNNNVSNNTSIIKKQADNIQEKDDYIEMLLKRISNLSNTIKLNKSKLKISLDQIDEYFSLN